MPAFTRLLAAEGIKGRRAPLLRLVWLLPLLFIALEFLVFERPALGLRSLPPELRQTLDGMQVKLLVAFWGGYFHPLMLALVPALVFRPEHRFRTWRRLFAMPVPRRQVYLAKAVWTLALTAFMLALIGLLLLGVHRAVAALNPVVALPFHGRQMLRALGWMWLGSLPVLAIYIWASDRINSLAVPIMLGLVGLILTMALTGQELAQPWRRDLIPWVLPYVAAEQTIHTGISQQEAHLAGKFFEDEPGFLRLPNGRKFRVHANAKVEDIFPPPPPTPAWLLATFSAVAGLVLLGLGWLDAGRQRT
jgi:hypothetical protein